MCAHAVSVEERRDQRYVSISGLSGRGRLSVPWMEKVKSKTMPCLGFESFDLRWDSGESGFYTPTQPSMSVTFGVRNYTQYGL